MTSMEYLAGFFDGEGCVSLTWHKRDKRWCPQVAIQLKRDTRNMRLLSIFCRHYEVKLCLTQTTCRFTLNKHTAVQQFVEDVLPYSTLKKTQLLLLRSYLEERTYGFRICQQLKSHKRRE